MIDFSGTGDQLEKLSRRLSGRELYHGAIRLSARACFTARAVLVLHYKIIKLLDEFY
jgi:hypothetical protein